MVPNGRIVCCLLSFCNQGHALLSRLDFANAPRKRDHFRSFVMANLSSFRLRSPTALQTLANRLVDCVGPERASESRFTAPVVITEAVYEAAFLESVDVRDPAFKVVSTRRQGVENRKLAKQKMADTNRTAVLRMPDSRA